MNAAVSRNRTAANADWVSRSASNLKSAAKFPEYLNYEDYPYDVWIEQMFSSKVLPRHGSFAITYPDGMHFVLPLLQSLEWAHKDDPTKAVDRGANFFWCSGPTAKEITILRELKKCKNMVFISSLPNIYCLHNKKILIEIIQEYERKVFRYTCSHEKPCNAVSNIPNYLKLSDFLRSLSSDSFIPKTLINLNAEELEYIADHFFTESSIWIAKPLTRNCGKGIEIIRSREKLKELIPLLPNLVIQRYIRNPLLLDDRKSDMRVYLLLVCPVKHRLLAFYHPGFVRLSLKPYKESSDDAAIHLTNQAVAKKTAEWMDHKDKSTWSPMQMNEYLNRNQSLYNFRQDFVFETLHPMMKNILSIVTRSAFTRISKVGGCFEFLGCDFMVDSKGNVWLIEMNCYPGMAVSTNLLKAMKPGVVQEAACLAMETIASCHNNTNIHPIKALRSFQLLWDSDLQEN